MKKNIFFASALVVLGLTACENGFDEYEENLSPVQTEQVAKANSLLQLRTRAAGDEDATISYPVQVYVFKGNKCESVQTKSKCNKKRLSNKNR